MIQVFFSVKRGSCVDVDLKLLPDIPRVGDTVRVDDGEPFRVTEVQWDVRVIDGDDRPIVFVYLERKEEA